ncbi:Ulp1 protease [Gracilaria domingensis]|nr:Ulp1 protease [Gracilaria domingensis]
MDFNIFQQFEEDIEKLFLRRRVVQEGSLAGVSSSRATISSSSLAIRSRRKRKAFSKEKDLNERKDNLLLRDLTAKEKSVIAFDPESFSFENITVSASVISQLRTSEGWVDNDFMDLFAARLRKRNIDRFQGFGNCKKVVVLDSFFISRLGHVVGSEKRCEVFEDLHRWFQKTSWSFKDTEVILSPFLADRHWFLLAINMDYSMITVYDSFLRITNTATEASQLMKDFLDFMESKLKRPQREWVVLEKSAYPRQTDGGSCGIFVAWVMENLERGAVPLFKQHDIEVLRSRAELFIKGYSCVPLEMFSAPTLRSVKTEVVTESPKEISEACNDEDRDSITSVRGVTTQQESTPNDRETNPSPSTNLVSKNETHMSQPGNKLNLNVIMNESKESDSNMKQNQEVPSKRIRRPPKRFR